MRGIGNCLVAFQASLSGASPQFSAALAVASTKTRMDLPWLRKASPQMNQSSSRSQATCTSAQNSAMEASAATALLMAPPQRVPAKWVSMQEPVASVVKLAAMPIILTMPPVNTAHSPFRTFLSSSGSSSLNSDATVQNREISAAASATAANAELALSRSLGHRVGLPPQCEAVLVAFVAARNNVRTKAALSRAHSAREIRISSSSSGFRRFPFFSISSEALGQLNRTAEVRCREVAPT
mmetsp:Transcript_30471/g.90290  ORF Transcript_30471/g.90290 Transcript_30471/m.90290 type:complete len:239 (-) Transcript_30471:529-1245(-)